MIFLQRMQIRESNFFFFFFFLGWGVGGGGRGLGVGGWTDEQAQAFKCDLGLQPRLEKCFELLLEDSNFAKLF